MDHAAHVAAASAPGAHLAAVLFLTALFGGFAHCTAMCGPFVLAQLSPEGPSLTRLVGAAALPYHLGRLLTYASLGAFAGGFGATLASVTSLAWLPSLFLAAAAVLFMLQALALASDAPAFVQRLAARLARVAAPAPHLAPRLGGVLLGVALGFLPCGFLYAALVAAAGAGSMAGGALAMSAFALGTMPSLIAVGMAGALAGARWRSVARQARPFVLGFNAAVLASLAAWTAA